MTVGGKVAVGEELTVGEELRVSGKGERVGR